jgi:hypothetical protein
MKLFFEAGLFSVIESLFTEQVFSIGTPLFRDDGQLIRDVVNETLISAPLKQSCLVPSGFASFPFSATT